ncbi:MAG TPA: hypothetical protein DEX20_01490, partial [Halieaceae bacterium]|nr:hypothetical protein [Halieaceae bacterium]
MAHDDQYEEQGSTAFDSLDGDLDTVRQGSVGSAPDTYTLTYSATDLSGNSAQKTRFVTVEA